MNAPAQPEKNEEGGMLVAAMAGGAILLAIALVMFSGGDEADEVDGDDEVAASASAADGKKSGSSASAFKKRQVDDASRHGGRENADPATAKAQPALEAGPHRQSRMVPNMGMAAPDDVPKGPPEFKTKEEELNWWNRQLDGAKMLKQRRENALAQLAEAEKNAGPDAADSMAKKRQGLEDALQRSNDKVAEIEKKISEL